MALNKNYITDTPQFRGSNLPQLDDFGGDVPAYMAALKAAYEADTNNSAPAYAAPGSFTTPDGQQMQSAGYHLDKSAGELAADAYNRIMQRASMSQVKGPSVGLTASSRMGVRPEEAAMAYNAYKLGDSGLPEFLMNDYMANLMEASGMRPPAAPEQPTVDHPSRVSGRGPRDGKPPRGRPIDPGQDRPPLDGGYGSTVKPPLDGGYGSAVGGSPATPGAGFPLPGDYPPISNFNPPSGLNIPKPGYGSEMHTMKLGNAGGNALDVYQQGQQSGVPGKPLLPYNDETQGGGPWVNYASAQGNNMHAYPPGLLQALQGNKMPFAPKAGY